MPSYAETLVGRLTNPKPTALTPSINMCSSTFGG